jgi:hypothetical protein
VWVDEAENVSVEMIPDLESLQTEYPFQQLGLFTPFSVH